MFYIVISIILFFAILAGIFVSLRMDKNISDN